METGKRSKALVVAISCVLCIAAVFAAIFAATVFAADGEKEDAMNAIEAAFSDYKVVDTVSVSNDGYIGIPVGITTYYDVGKGKAVPGYNGTPLIIYVINTCVERIGTRSDVDIIRSMLERGYIVSVLDYGNDEKAVSPGLDWSTQTLRQKFRSGGYFTDKAYLPNGTYYDTFVVPAGYDVSLSNVFWEADRHGADGTLEWIVSNWNTDFRGCFANKIIYWRDAEGTRKATQTGIDGSSPEWYSDPDGKVKVSADSADAKYIKITHTLAEDITDCVGADGTPVDLKLYMHVVYPAASDTEPIKKVPVIALANSSEYLSDGMNTAGRPQFSGFLFNGYAGAVFDYLYQPMAQADYYGYYDGRVSLGAMTNDRMNYGLQLYNDKRINTAAMRYLRYLAGTDGATYAFDTEAIGVIGNSKGGWFTFLGEAELREFTVSDTDAYSADELKDLIDGRINSYSSKRVFDDHHNETRYQNGKTASYTKRGVTVNGGELQPWLTYTDGEGAVHEILGYASWIYASNGSQPEDITAGYAPIYAVLHTGDDFTTTNNAFAEVSGKLDVPSFYCVVDLGHTFAYGPDAVHGFDTYQTMFDFANYYLKKSAVKVVYTDPVGGSGGLDTALSMTVKFSGAVPLSEVSKITLKDAAGKTVCGTWRAARGMTEWTFSPEILAGGTEYTLKIPSELKGDNGVPMGEDVELEFYTEAETVNGVSYVVTSGGIYVTAEAKKIKNASDAAIRFYVSNDAANIMELYEVTEYDADSPRLSVIGKRLGSVNLSGSGYYEIDISDNILNADAGDTLTFFLKEKKTAGVTDTYNATFETSLSGLDIGRYSRGTVSVAPDGTEAAKLYVSTNIASSGNAQYGADDVFYDNQTTLFTNGTLFGTQKISADDLGRKYKITLRVYDTVSRVLTVTLNGAYTSTNGVLDFDRVYYNIKTVAGEWKDIEIDYTVYEPKYGDGALSVKTLTVFAGSANGNESPIYIESLTVTETVTNVEVGENNAVSLVFTERGRAFVPSKAEYPFSVREEYYSTLSAALSAANNGDTVKLNSNYTLTSSDDFTDYGRFSAVTIDLNGYKLYTDSQNPVIHTKALSLTQTETNITVKNGDVILSYAPFIGYSGSASAEKGKIFGIYLENVNIINSTASRLTEVISAGNIEKASGASVKISLDGCTVDIKKSKNSNNPITVFPTGEGSLNVTYTVKGGELKLDTSVRVTLWNKFKKLEFIRDEDEKYTILSLPSSVRPFDAAVRTESNTARFTLSGTEKLISVYAVRTSNLSTVYGLIPEQYADTEMYPFIMFDENGNFKGAYSSFLNKDSGALNAAKNYVVNKWDGNSYGTDPREAFIIMRRDYTLSKQASMFDNLAQAQGTINIDLGGYTLSAGSVEYPLLPAFSKGFSGAAGIKVFPTAVRVNNGALYNYRNGIVGMSTWDSISGCSIANKDFSFIFSNVTFGFVDGAESAGLIAHGRSAIGTPGAAAPFNFTYNDCTFDLRTTKAKYDPVIFSLGTTAGRYIKMTVKVNGGKVISDDPSKVTLVQTSASDVYGSSVTFGKGSDGNYTSWYVPSGYNVPVGDYTDVSGKKLGFKFGTDSGNDDVFVLAESPLSTVYGTVSAEYADPQTYPFALFDGNGNFLKAYGTMKQAVDAAKVRNESNSWDQKNKTYGAQARTSVILLRRNYTTVTADKYDNWAQNKGTVTIDLGGYTLMQGSGTAAVFTEIVSKGWGGAVFPSTYNIKNGSILVLDKSVMLARLWATVNGNGEMENKDFTWNFDEVNFGFAPGATSENLLISYLSPIDTKGYPPDVAAPFWLNYTNCTFDLETNAPNSGVTLFNAAPQNGYYLKTAVTVTGGKIKSARWENSILYTVENVYGSSVGFAKTENGSYTAFYTAEGAAPTDAVSTADGNLYYVRSGKDGKYTVYKPMSAGVKGFVPKTSISLYSDLVYNIYLPASADILSITLDGETIDIQKLRFKEINGENYYWLTRTVAVSNAAERFVLSVVLDIGNGKTATGTWNMSIVTYAKNGIENAENTETEKTLLKDVLAYIVSAYTYVNKPNALAVRSEISKIIGESYAETSLPNEDSLEIKTELPGLDGVAFRLASSPEYTFYPETDESGNVVYGAENYVFTQNGNTIKSEILTDSKGRTYIKVTSYAYGVSSDISYAVKGTAISGEYNIKTYLEGAKALENSEELVDLVKRLWKYSESAANYRDLLLGN